MDSLPDQPRFTPDDVIHLEDEGLYELVDGRLLEMPSSSLASMTAAHISGKVGEYVLKRDVGHCYAYQTFQCFPGEANRVRRPDLAFIANERDADVSETGHVKIAPDLAVYIVRPGDTVNDSAERVADYRSAGVRLVWVVNPKQKAIRIHRADRSVSELFDGDTLTGDPVLPGFSVAVSELFPKPL